MENILDVIIIGAGPAGLTAAIYAKRAELKALLIERYSDGGQILNTYEVDNYPGLAGVSGIELGSKFSEHADKFNIERVNAEVTGLELTGEVKKVHTYEGDYQAHTVILATGNSPRKLGVPGEEELTGCGVSYCATCDGAFFKNRTVAVVGGGDVAVEDAIFLARGCSKVYVVHRRDELRAAKILQNALFALDNVEMVWNSVVTSIDGEDDVTSITIENVADGSKQELTVQGVFVATGNEPNASYIEGLECDKNGYIVAGEDCNTSIAGVFVAGDLRQKRVRQVSTAVGDGANAIYSVQEYLVGLTK